MSIRGRLTVIAAVVGLVFYPLWWAQTGSPTAKRIRAERAQAAACQLVKTPGGAVRVLAVRVSVSRYPENWRHIVDARHGRNTAPDGETVDENGLKWPTVLTLHRAGKDARRDVGMAMSGLHERAGKARDEYPPAFARTTNAADFRYVDRRANSGQGASMGNQLRGKCDGQLFRLVAVP